MNIVVKMTASKETKGTYVYKADSHDAAVQVLYILKKNVKVKPEKITLTIK